MEDIIIEPHKAYQEAAGATRRGTEGGQLGPCPRGSSRLFRGPLSATEPSAGRAGLGRLTSQGPGRVQKFLCIWRYLFLVKYLAQGGSKGPRIVEMWPRASHHVSMLCLRPNPGHTLSPDPGHVLIPDPGHQALRREGHQKGRGEPHASPWRTRPLGGTSPAPRGPGAEWKPTPGAPQAHQSARSLLPIPSQAARTIRCVSFTSRSITRSQPICPPAGLMPSWHVPHRTPGA